MVNLIVLYVLLSGIADLILGLFAFLFMTVVLFFFLNWLSRATNTKFVSRVGGRVIVDNTVKNQPHHVKISKTEEQIKLEESLLAQRIHLRKSQEEYLKKQKEREVEQENAHRKAKLKYEEDLRNYEENKRKYEENARLRVEKEKVLKKEPNEENPDQNEEFQSIFNSLDFHPLLPILPLPDLSIKVYSINRIEEKQKQERRALRCKHAELIEFESEIEKRRFINSDLENEINRTRVIDMNAINKSKIS